MHYILTLMSIVFISVALAICMATVIIFAYPVARLLWLELCVIYHDVMKRFKKE